MKIGMQTWGSHGDIRPFLALAEGLQRAGHEVHLVLTCVDSDAYKHVVSEHGVRITVIGSPVLRPEQQEGTIRMAHAIRNPMKQMDAILQLCFAPVEDLMFDAAQRLARESDLLIGHFFMHPLQIAAEHAGRPYVSVILSHATIPSDFHHPAVLGNIGKLGNRLLWTLTRFMLNRALGHYPNRLRRNMGMPATRDIVNELWLSRELTLAAISPRICRAQPDWPPSVKVCGFLDAPNSDIDGSLPAALDTFLAAGEAPVYMTLGSWMPRDTAGQTETLQLLTEAARSAGCRAIIQSLAPQDCGFHSDEQILYVQAAPHQTLFPQCRAVIHHGGAGTTQSATLAGKPSIVIAHLGEQEHWGRELRRLGIAGNTLRRRNLTAARLARAITAVLDAPAMALAAQRVGTDMRTENGVAEAVKLITETQSKKPHQDHLVGFCL
jgi:sterol 3beta-glucosyltransferase